MNSVAVFNTAIAIGNSKPEWITCRKLLCGLSRHGCGMQVLTANESKKRKKDFSSTSLKVIWTQLPLITWKQNEKCTESSVFTLSGWIQLKIVDTFLNPFPRAVICCLQGQRNTWPPWGVRKSVNQSLECSQSQWLICLLGHSRANRTPFVHSVPPKLLEIKALKTWTPFEPAGTASYLPPTFSEKG